MPGYTSYFGLAYFDQGDDLSTSASAALEMSTFTIIDKQLYGLYSIFGNGVVSGWTVASPVSNSATNISVNVSAGVGIIDSLAASSISQQNVSGLPPNSTVYIFAALSGITTLTRDITFFFTGTPLGQPSQLLLAAVTTGDSGIATIDNTVRQQIGFQALIDEQIALHHHRGSPTKIDLANETQGQLPASKVGNLSANQITSGIFDPARIGQVDHNTLLNKGLFTHPQLDTFVQTLSNSEDQLMGVQTLINQLKQLIFMKSEYSNYDQDWVNALAIIPGITPDSSIDFTVTDAYVSDGSNCIAGYPVESTENLSVLWNTDPGFNGAYSQTNVTVLNGVSISRSDQSELIVEGFEEGPNSPAFTVTVIPQNSMTISEVNTDTFQTQGNYSGFFSMNQNARITFTKTITAQDWSAYDTLAMDVRCTNGSHNPVYFYFIDAVGGVSSTYTVLSTNQTTSNTDPTMENFITQTFLLGATPRTSVTQMVIFSDNVESESDFWLDNIRLHLSQSYFPQGSIRLRYTSSTPVVFNTLIYSGTLPAGTTLKARIRVASDLIDLNNSLFTAFMQSGSSFALRGTMAEIELDLLSDSTQSYTPILTMVELGFSANSVTNGFTTQTITDWNYGTSSNLQFTGTTNVDVTITSPICVGDFSFLMNSLVSEVNASYDPVFAVTGDNLPMSLSQAFAGITGSTSVGFNNPLSVVRTADRRFIVCDTGNDRILYFDDQGNLTQGYCGADQDQDLINSDAVPLTATYNPSTGILWLGFSKTVSITQANFSLINVQIGSQSIYLTDEGIDLSTPSATGRVIGVQLTIAHQSLLQGVTHFIYVSYGASLSPTFNPLYGGRLVRIYVAPVTFISDVFNPVYAIEKNDGSGDLWICNATQLVYVNGVAPVTPDVKTLWLFNPLQDTGISTKSVYFSTFFGGSILELTSGKVMAAGLDANLNGRLYSDALASTPVIIYGSPFNSQPTSISLDSSGNYWVSESSYTAQAGRILKFDVYGNILTDIHGAYDKINRVQVLTNDDLLVST